MDPERPLQGDHETAEATIRARLEAVDDETLVELLLDVVQGLQQGDIEVTDLSGPG